MRGQAPQDQATILNYLYRRLAAGDRRYCTIPTIRTDISSILIIAGAIAACTAPGMDRASLALRQSQLREIASGCGLRADALWLDEAGGIRFRPSPETRYEVVDCTLAQLRDRGLAKHMPMAFVGNATPAEEVGNHASPR